MKRPAKFWLIGVTASLVLFVAANFLLWISVTSKLFALYPHCGDLARLSYSLDFSQCRNETITLKKRQVYWSSKKRQPVDVVTVGDSFSRGSGAGQDNYYQDHIATHFDLNVMHLEQLRDRDHLATIVELKRSGLLAKFGVKHVVLELSEKSVPKMKRKYDMAAPARPLPEIERELDGWIESYERGMSRYRKLAAEREAFYTSASFSHRFGARLLQFICSQFDRGQFQEVHLFVSESWIGKLLGIGPEDGEYKYFAIDDAVKASFPKILNINMNWLAHKVLPHGVLDTSVAPAMQLEAALFSTPHPDQLVVHSSDLKVGVKLDDESMLKTVHENLNEVADLLAEDGIQLHFMPIPTKLTAYQDVVRGGTFQKSEFFTRFPRLPGRRYELVDTATPIQKLISSGVKDVYFADDTHWSSVPIPSIVAGMKLGTPARRTP